jgi:membrane-bound lytic murein transglycosylase D
VQQASVAAAGHASAGAAIPHAGDSIRVDPNDVSRRAAEVFGGPDAAPADNGADAAPEASWDIDVHSYESMDRVEHYVSVFSGTAKERIEERLDRGTRYEPMIRAKLRAGGLPEDMYYLALVESGYDPNAYSRAAAVGMWQFMTSTGRDMGLRIDWWIDERRDPVKSTDAAVRFISDLREQFGSLYLAAAAYNGGPGRIARGLSRYADDFEGTTGDDLFFALAEKDYLRNETREYVPQLIAAALIAKEPARYGMTITPEPPFAYDSVRVGPSTPLAAVAAAAGAKVDAVRELNPEILRGMTPPKDSFMVRIPVGAADSFPAAFAALPASARKAYEILESKKGQSIATIAKKAGLSTRQLELYNPSLRRLRSGNLVAGQKVMVPTEAVVDAAAPVPDPAIERYSSGTTTQMHVVKSGETLSGIAKHYHTTTAALMRENGLRRALILAGQSLVVSGGTAATKRAASAKKSTSKKSGARVSATKKPAAKKSTAKPSATKKSAAKKTTAKKPAAKKTTTRKSPRK